MTTIIIIIIAVAVLAGLGSKMFLKDSSGLSDQGGLSLSVKTKDRLLEGKALWSWSLSLNKKGSVEEVITWGQKALKIYDALKNSEAIDIRNKIKSWSGE